jgi:hypothetical protein
MKEKISYLDETLKRLPIIVLGLSCAWYVITKLNNIENKVEKIELLSFKDKEAIYNDIQNIQTFAANNSNRTNELEKNVIRLMATVPNTRLKIEDEDNN